MLRYVIRTNIVLLVLALSFPFVAGCGDSKSTSSETASAASSGQSGGEQKANDQSDQEREKQLAFIEGLRPKVEAFCGDCHVMPRPSSSSKDDWHEEVAQGYRLYRESGRNDLTPPPEKDVLRFFQLQAPRSLAAPDSIHDYPKSKVAFQPTTAGVASSRPPGVTHVKYLDLGIKPTKALVYCNIGTGAVSAHWPAEPNAPSVRLATLLQPVQLSTCDLNADGHTDLVVADIGEFNANDSDLGRVMWLRRNPDSKSFKPVVLLENVSRVSSVEPGDYDNDGDTDLLVAVFGWRRTGQTLLMINQGTVDDQGTPKFETKQLDDRHGTSHVPPIDLNGDGFLDYISLVSQDYESVEAHLNDGNGNFVPELLWQAPDPAYGSSSIELLDFESK